MRKGQRSGEYRHCEQCGESFYLYPSDLRRGRGTYCSRDCQLAGYKADGNPKWRGGRFKTVSGYVYRYAPDHPNATKTGYVMEHRLVMERSIGRYLRPEEQVHHINHVRDDNRLENLRLTANVTEHRAVHAYYVDEPCGWCGEPITRSLAHRRRWDRGFCSRGCAARAGSRAAVEKQSHLGRRRDPKTGQFLSEAT